MGVRVYGVHTSHPYRDREAVAGVEVMNNPIVIHAEQSQGTAFGDERLVKRGLHCTRRSTAIAR
jgi:hypothetical protein